MRLAGRPLARHPLATGRGPAPAPAAFELLALRPDGAGQYLVEIEAYQGGEARSGGAWSMLARRPLAATPRGGGVDVGIRTLTYADRDWIGAPDDAQKPNAFYEGRVGTALDVERLMPVLPEEPRRVQRQYGSLVIANGDGALDSIVQSYAVDGRAVRVKWGGYMAGYADFGTVADMLGVGWEADALAVRLFVRDQSYSLDTPLQTTLYAGTGGAEGTAEIAGKPKPLAWGPVTNATPVLVDPANLIWQIHDGAIAGLDDVFERAEALVASGVDVADYAALVAQAVSPGEYATCLAAGLFKLGAQPGGVITVDLRGDADPSYIDTLDLIAQRILTVRAGFAATRIVTATFAGAAAIGGPIQLYIGHDARPTTAEVLDRLLGSVGGWWGAARDGRLRAGRLTAPEERTPNIYLGPNELLSLEPEAAPTPRWRQRVSWGPNWTSQRGEDLSANVTAARRQFLTEADRVVAAASATVLNRHLLALDPPPLQSLYAAEADAQTLADYLVGLHAVDRRIYRGRVKRASYLVDLGHVANVTWPRHGLGNGRNFAVVGIRETGGPDGDAAELRLWG